MIDLIHDLTSEAGNEVQQMPDYGQYYETVVEQESN